MIGLADTVKIFPMSWTVAGMTAVAKPCDSCKSAASILFCRADSAYLCMCCDAKIHGANKLASRHERVWMCEVCEQAPAAFTCKADAASLCVTCDDDIHSANPLARRHDRIPVQPFFESAASLLKSSSTSSVGAAATLTSTGGANEFVAAVAAASVVNYLVPSNDEIVEAASWWFLHDDTDVITTTTNNKVYDDTKVLKNGDDAFFSDFDHLLDFDYQNTILHHHNHQHKYNHGADSLVPVQQIFNTNHNGNNNSNSNSKNTKNQRNETSFDMDFCNSKLTPFNYITTATKTQSSTHSISTISSSSLLDVGIVPDGSYGTSETSFSFSFGKQTTTNSNVTGAESQLFGMDREARVLRYREKRKNRKFEKTIRYASRKAYAETRPRIKGRFAKRLETESEEIDVDGLFVPVVGSATFMIDTGYGVVPSF